MAAKTNYLRKRIVDHILGKFTYSRPAGVFLALFTEVPNAAGSTASEVAGGGYGRQAISGVMQAADTASGSTTNDTAITFGSPTANWGLIRGFAVMDAQTGGNMLLYASFDPPREILAGAAPFVVPAGTLIVQDT